MPGILTEHPDEALDWREYKQRRVSAHQAIEDKALQVYHESYLQGREIAEQKYFETFKMAYGKLDTRK